MDGLEVECEVRISKGLEMLEIPDRGGKRGALWNSSLIKFLK